MDKFTNSRSQSSHSHRSGRDSDRSSGSRRGDVKCPQCRTRFSSQGDLEFHQMTIPFCSRSSQPNNVDVIPRSRIENRRPTEHRPRQLSSSDARPVGDSGRPSSHRSGRDSDRSSGSRRGEVTCPQCRTRFSSQGDLEFHQMTIPFCSRTSQANNVDAIPRSRIEYGRSTELRPRQLSSSDARSGGDSGRPSSHRSGRDSDGSSGSRRGEVTCPQCKTPFRSQSDLEFHQMTTPFCSRSNNVDAIPKSRIESHRSTGHRPRQLSSSDARSEGDSGRSSSRRSGRDSDRSSGSRRGDVKCPQCRTRFRSQSDLEFHQMTIPFCSRSSQASNVDIIPKSRIESHRSTENQSGQASGSHHTESRKVIDKSKRKRHTCTQCQKSFMFKGSLVEHFQDNHEEGEARYRCQTCGLSFSRRNFLRAHIRQVHEADVGYKCNHCSYETGAKLNINRHIRWKHKKVVEEGDFSQTRKQ